MMKRAYISLLACLVFMSAVGSRAKAATSPAGVDPAVTRLPLVAIVAERGKSGFEDLLLSELTTQGRFQLLEREELWRVQEEIATSAGFKNALQMATRLQADGLLIITGGKEKLVRLVETTRGAILAQWLVNPADGDMQQTARGLAEALASQAPRLLMPAGSKLFVSLRSGRSDNASASDSDATLLSRLNSLVSYKLSRDPSMVLVERENFAAVVEEAPRSPNETNGWITADAVISLKGDREQADSLHCTYQVQGPRVSKPQSQTFTVDYASLETTAESIVQFLRKTMVMDATANPSNRIDLRQEAALYVYMAKTAVAHKDYRRALPLLELAALLCPNEYPWRTEFVRATVQHLAVHAAGSMIRSRGVKEAEYMELVHWLRQAVCFQRNIAPGNVNALLRDPRSFQFLTRDVRTFQAENRHEIACLRAELRALIPLIVARKGGDQGDRGIKLLAGVAAVFFDDPESALAELDKLMSIPSFPLYSLHQRLFLEVRYWDHAKARQLWMEMLSELARSEDVNRQAMSCIGLCYVQGAFDLHVWTSTNLPAARSAALQLFKWMETNQSVRAWLMEGESWYINGQLWNALLSLPVEQQDDYYSRVMLPLVKEYPSEKTWAVYYLRVRWHEGFEKNHTPNDRQTIRRLMQALYETLKSNTEGSFSEWLKPYLRETWVAEVFAEPLQANEFVYPDIPGGKLLFDSELVFSGRPRQHDHIFESFTGYQDGRWLWVTWRAPEGIGLARIDTDSQETRCFVVPLGRMADASVRWGLVITRAQNRLFVSDMKHIYAIPLNGDIPVCDHAALTVLGPQIGEHALGVAKKHVSAMTASGGYLYFALNQWVSNRKVENLCGAIYRWDGQHPPEQLAASDSLSVGPLNNCLPYDIFAAFTATNGEHIYFVLAAAPGQPTSRSEGQRTGIWEYEVKTTQWRQVFERDYVFPERAVSVVRMASPDVFDFGDQLKSYRFTPSSGGLIAGVAPIPSPDLKSGFSVRYSRDSDDEKGHDFIFIAAKGSSGKRLFRLLDGEFQIKKVFTSREGFYVLISVRPGGVYPAFRGFIYFVPFDYAKGDVSNL